MASRALLVLGLVVALAVSASSQAVYCAYAGTKYLPIDNGTLGCIGYGVGTFNWYLDGLATCTFYMTSANLVNGATVTIYGGTKSAATYTGTSTGNSVTVDGGRVTMTTQFGYSNTYGFILKYACSPIVPSTSIQSLVSRHSVYVANKTKGGFVYVSLGKQVDGANQMYSMQVTSYNGLKPPSFFVGVNRLPTLESYDYTANTVSDDNGGFVWQWTQQSPPDATYVIGMFLYGTFGGVYAYSSWNYKYPVIPFGTPLTGSNTYCGQFQLDLKAKSFTLQVSREAPGGFPIFYVGRGYRPTVSKNDYVLDTNKQSFQELTVKAPVVVDGPNPGLWVVCTQDAFQGAFILGVNPA